MPAATLQPQAHTDSDGADIAGAGDVLLRRAKAERSRALKAANEAEIARIKVGVWLTGLISTQCLLLLL